MSKRERWKTFWSGLFSRVGGAEPLESASFQQGAAQVLNKKMDRRKALGALVKGATVGGALVQSGCSPLGGDEKLEKASLNWEEYFKKNYRVMSDAERQQTVERLTRLHKIEAGRSVDISTTKPREGVLYGYAFNVSKCQGYMDCVDACVKENNLDRKTGMQYIRIFEVEDGQSTLTSANGKFHHEVPAEGHYYMGTQCFHCDNPPCVPVCPVGATWREDDGIVVVDYDWCIGCRYCEAACPYFGRRFNWGEPEVPAEEQNPHQHYLGNRPRHKGSMEKCTFCIQRTRHGKNPACMEACPTGAPEEPTRLPLGQVGC